MPAGGEYLGGIDSDGDDDFSGHGYKHGHGHGKKYQEWSVRQLGAPSLPWSVAYAVPCALCVNWELAARTAVSIAWGQ